MGQVHSFAAFTLAIILLGVPARPQSIPSSQVSANDLAWRVITNCGCSENTLSFFVPRPNPWWMPGAQSSGPSRTLRNS